MMNSCMIIFSILLHDEWKKYPVIFSGEGSNEASGSFCNILQYMQYCNMHGMSEANIAISYRGYNILTIYGSPALATTCTSTGYFISNNCISSSVHSTTIKQRQRK